MSEEKKNTERKKTRGPEPLRLKIHSDWKDAVKKSFEKKTTKRSSK
jgi:hypothetical protein